MLNVLPISAPRLCVFASWQPFHSIWTAPMSHYEYDEWWYKLVAPKTRIAPKTRTEICPLIISSLSHFGPQLPDDHRPTMIPLIRCSTIPPYAPSLSRHKYVAYALDCNIRHRGIS